jgi:hypothetical protein
MIPSAPADADRAARACPRCRATLQPLVVAGHDERRIELDLCRPCEAVWFDAQEALGLSGLGWLSLLREFSLPGEHRVPLEMTQAMTCPCCPGPPQPLQMQHDQTRYGRYVLHACGTCRGHFQSQALLFAQHGLMRPLRAPERWALAREGRSLDCREGEDAACRHCGTPALVFDPPRMLQSMLRGLGPQARGDTPAGAGHVAAWPCRQCGRPLDPTQDTVCTSCRHPVVVRHAGEMPAVLDAIEQALRARGSERERRRRLAAAATERVMGAPTRHAAERDRDHHARHRWPDALRPDGFTVTVALVVGFAALMMSWVFGRYF